MNNNLVNLSTQMSDANAHNADANANNADSVLSSTTTERSSNVPSTLANPPATLPNPNPAPPNSTTNPSQSTPTQVTIPSVSSSVDHTATTTERSNAKETQKRSRPSKSNPNSTNAKDSAPPGPDSNQRPRKQPNELSTLNWSSNSQISGTSRGPSVDAPPDVHGSRTSKTFKGFGSRSPYKKNKK
ncbi:hypothetical protein PGTUg99_024368 [Puccinia graminis f. sp. tritici]|uniref:Uncharacterized protein n=1 Tax=Puccinia graminis f. sp. tritici TaxID=56615 RepID=A0A5B0R5Q4_PUCGR|nr:hypothetical protein PGTUg99_024368 [Puccinia graminis f. sp. tritici]